jgi:hypothetical protein
VRAPDKLRRAVAKASAVLIHDNNCSGDGAALSSGCWYLSIYEVENWAFVMFIERELKWKGDMYSLANFLANSLLSVVFMFIYYRLKLKY